MKRRGSRLGRGGGVGSGWMRVVDELDYGMMFGIERLERV